MKKIYSLIAVASIGLSLGGCNNDATVVKQNIAKAADNFEVNRRIIFYNTWKDTQILVVEGLCSVEYRSDRTYYICKIGPHKYINNFIGDSEFVTAIVEQLDPLPVNAYHYRRTFKPQAIIPDIDFRGDTGELLNAVTPDNND